MKVSSAETKGVVLTDGKCHTNLVGKPNIAFVIFFLLMQDGTMAEIT